MEEIGQRESIDVDERVVEQKIVQNIKNFIMTLVMILLYWQSVFIWNHME